MNSWKKKLSLPVVLVVVMLVLLCVLATLQYRWLGQISSSEKERMHRNLQASATSFSRDFDREITRAYTIFQLEKRDDKNFSEQLVERFTLWKSTAPYSQLVSDVFVVEKDKTNNLVLSRFNTQNSVLEKTDWSDDLKPLYKIIEKNLTNQNNNQESAMPPPAPPMAKSDSIEPNIPALITPVMPGLHIFTQSGDMPQRIPFQDISEFTIIKLNRDFITTEFIPTLARNYFSGTNGLEYNVTILNTDNQNIIFNSSQNSVSQIQNGDANTNFLRLRIDEVSPVLMFKRRNSQKGDNSSAVWESRYEQTDIQGKSDFIVKDETANRIPRNAEQQGTVSVKVINRSGVEEITEGTIINGVGTGYWRLVVQHRTGSLETFIANTRFRNLGISFGILILLAASVTMIFLATRRSQILAQRQLEFVSSVSHEFRTPLAVICSAGENLADGIVESKPQVQKYGKLVLGEGRRLTDMIEQVLEFAGAQAKRKPLEFHLVNVELPINDALQACKPLLDEKDFTLEVETETQLPFIKADERYLSRAVQNLINNAIKYDTKNRHIRVKTFVENERVVITVADKGRGISPDELKEIFEPFYRGRDVVSEQIHGNGLGLSLVKKTVEAHKGNIRVESRLGYGAEFFISLPIAKKATVEETLTELKTA